MTSPELQREERRARLLRVRTFGDGASAARQGGENPAENRDAVPCSHPTRHGEADRDHHLDMGLLVSTRDPMNPSAVGVATAGE
jgi:hypothetical protein